METSKKILQVIFGKASPLQLMLGCIFGSMLGFLPGFSYSPFMYLILILLTLILSINLGFLIIVFIVASILSYIVEPLSFYTGVGLLNGVAQPLFQSMVNTPVLAYAGFEYYLVTGGLAIAILFGIAIGLVVVWLFQSVRKRMANLQENSASYQKIVNKFWIKCLTWILLGKAAHKVNWVKLRDKKVGQPFRITGIVIVAIIIALLFVLQSFIQSQMITNILRSQLEKANGATVNLQSVDVDLANASVAIKGLAIANPNNLDYDRFYAQKLSAKLNIKALLTKRLSINDITIDKALTDHKRATRATLYAPTAESKPKTPETKPEKTSKQVTQFQIDQYVKDAKTLHSYENQIKRLIMLIDEHSYTTTETDSTPAIEQQIQSYGYAEIINNNLIEKTPRLTIEQLNIKQLKSSQLNKTLHVSAKNLATEPTLLNNTTEISVKAQDGSLSLYLNDQHKSGVKNDIRFQAKNLPANSLLNEIKFKNNFNLSANSMDAASTGHWYVENDGQISLMMPIDVTFNKVTLTSNNYKKQLDTLKLTVNLTNNLNNPIIELDQDQIQNIIVQAGISEAKSQVKEQIKDKVGDKIKDKIPDSFSF